MTDINPELRRETVRGLKDLLPSRLDRIKIYGIYIGERLKLANYEAFLAFHADPHEFSEARRKNTEELQMKMNLAILERV